MTDALNMRCLSSCQPLRALRRMPFGTSPLENVCNRLPLLQVADRTMGALPFAFLIQSLQCSKLRKHLLVRLNDLLLT